MLTFLEHLKREILQTLPTMIDLQDSNTSIRITAR